MDITCPGTFYSLSVVIVLYLWDIHPNSTQSNTQRFSGYNLPTSNRSATKFVLEKSIFRIVGITPVRFEGEIIKTESYQTKWWLRGGECDQNDETLVMLIDQIKCEQCRKLKMHQLTSNLSAVAEWRESASIERTVMKLSRLLYTTTHIDNALEI